jgi:NTP pyrophosphatase (non-canonical NTP hydrolase)
MSLTFRKLREANLARISNDKYVKCQTEWTTAHWLQALVGEIGELANILKKVDRGDYDGMSRVALLALAKDVSYELADIQTYLDILALKLEVDLGAATIEKFNIVSERVGSDVRLEAAGEYEAVVPMRGGMTLDEVNVTLFDECQRLQQGLLGMKPMEDAPKDGTYILLFAESGYLGVPWRCQVCKHDAEYRPLQPWVNHSGDSFTDDGEAPIGWLPLPEA